MQESTLTRPDEAPAPAGGASGISISPEDFGLEDYAGLTDREIDDLLRGTKADPDQYTDQWAANEVTRAVVSRVRYVPEREKFYVWDGAAWREDALNKAPRLVGETLIRLSDNARQQATNAASEGERKAARSFRRAAQGLPLQRRVLKLLKEHPDLVESVDSFDPDPLVLNTPGGIYSLATGEQSASDPWSMCAMCTAVEPEPGRPEKWLDFLADTTLNDPELTAFLQRWLGYLLTGLNVEKYLLIGVGRSDSGKSVFNNVVGRVLGSYHANIPQGSLLASQGNRHPADLAAFVGARVATSSEVPAGGARWRSDVVKQITGGDTLSVRKMRENFYEIEPRCRLMLFSNHTPTTSNDSAMLRRIVFVPFDNAVPLEEQDRYLEDTLVQDEGGRILNWMLEGARAYLANGLGEFPAAVKQATAEYKDAEDRLGRFLQDSCDLGFDHEDSSRNLFNAWRQWCQDHGHGRSEIGTQTAFTQLLRREAEEEYGLEYSEHITDPVTDKRARGFRGVRVQREEVLTADDPAVTNIETGRKAGR